MVYPTSLDIDDYVILQDTDDYAFSQDSVFLANTAKIAKEDRVLDLGCGTGILATLALVKKRASAAVGIELQPSVANLARESAKTQRARRQIRYNNRRRKGYKKSCRSGKFRQSALQSALLSRRANHKEEFVKDREHRNFVRFCTSGKLRFAIWRRRLVRFQNRQAFTAYLRPRAIQTRTQRNDNRLSQTFVGSGRCDNQGKKRRQSRT